MMGFDAVRSGLTHLVRSIMYVRVNFLCVLNGCLERRLIPPPRSTSFGLQCGDYVVVASFCSIELSMTKHGGFRFVDS